MLIQINHLNKRGSGSDTSGQYGSTVYTQGVQILWIQRIWTSYVVLSVPKFTANLYCICPSKPQI